MPPQSDSCYKSLPLNDVSSIGQGGGRWLSERHPPASFRAAQAGLRLHTGQGLPSRPFFENTEKGDAVMSTAKFKKPSTHYLLAGSVVVGEGFLEKDGSTIEIRLAEGASLHWKDRTKFRLLPVHRPEASRLPVASIA
jgi:hypothetical protein